MNTQDSLNTKSKNLFELISKNWEDLDESIKTKLIKIWKVLTYKWQLQILFNLPFLLWWVLDKSFPKVHKFDMTILNYLNLPDWALSFFGFGRHVKAQSAHNASTKSADPSAVGVSELCLLLQIPQIHTNPYSTKYCSSLILPLPPILPVA